MLVSAAFTPSSPLLLESINKDRREEIADTIRALEELADDWYAHKVATVVIISESKFSYPDAISLDVADPYTVDLSPFGDLGSAVKYHPDFSIIDSLQRHARRHGGALTMSTESSLPFSMAAPLSFLLRRLPKLKIVPIVTATQLDAKEHYVFGTLLKQAISDSTKRIGILAAGDVSLSHVETIKLTLEEKSTASLMNLEDELHTNENDASYLPLSILFGALDGMPARAEIRSLESPFEVGYVVAEFMI